MITTLRATAALIDDLFSDEEYKFFLTARLQTDPLERNFGKVRQMSGGRFLVGLREFISSQKILRIKSLLKADIEPWDERVKSNTSPNFQKLLEELHAIANEFQENALCESSREVAIEIAGYVAKQLLEKSGCAACGTILKKDRVSSAYLDLLNRGGLTKPSEALAEYVSSCFVILDTAHSILMRHSDIIREAAMKTMEVFHDHEILFMCEEHRDHGRKMVNRIITNIYFNNESKQKRGEIRKKQVVDYTKSRQRKKRKDQ